MNNENRVKKMKTWSDKGETRRRKHWSDEKKK